MYMKLLFNKIWLILFAPAVLCTSCYQEVIDLDLSEIERHIVVVGKMEEGSYSNHITLYRAGSLSTSDDFTPIPDAVVTLMDDSGNSETLHESPEGTYSTSATAGTVGRTYTLQVESEGKEYIAISSMPTPLKFDTIKFHLKSEYNSSYILEVIFKDNPGIPDYALINVYVNNNLVEKRLYNDKYSDGEEIFINDFKYLYYAGTDVKIEFITLDEPVYRYYSLLIGGNNTIDSDNENPDDITVDDLIGVTNYNPVNNITNGALGIFSAQCKRTYRPVVQ